MENENFKKLANFTQNYSKLVDIYYKPFLPKNISNIKLQNILKKRLQSHGPELARNIGRSNKSKTLSHNS